jgi:signal transduction histidine kinase
VPQEIGRVIINLLDNAFYAVNEQQLTQIGQYKAQVTISTTRNGEKVEIRIEDNGIGIPKTIHDKIFESFFTTKPTGSGTGLGLSLCFHIVTKGHGGTLSVESEDRKGSTFIVSLPIF